MSIDCDHPIIEGHCAHALGEELLDLLRRWGKADRSDVPCGDDCLLCDTSDAIAKVKGEK